MKLRCIVCSLLALSLLASTFGLAAEHADEETKAPRFVADKVITKKTADLGGKLFMVDEDAEKFSSRYTEKKFEGKNLVDAINNVKTRKEGDGLKKNTPEDEKPVAEAIADLMTHLTRKTWDEGYDALKSLVDGYKKQGDSDTQKEEFAKRLWVAFNNWGKDKNGNDIEQPPSDPRMQAFFDAFKEARKDAEEKVAKMEKFIDEASKGSMAAKKKLWGDPNDKDPESKNNQWAVGKDVVAKINHLFAKGESEKAQKLIKALSDPNTGNFSINNGEGKPLNLETKGLSAKALENTFKTEKMKASEFVGNPHEEANKPGAWVWNKEKGDVELKGPVSPQVAGAGGAGAGGQQGANAAAAGAQAKQSQGAPAASSNGGDVNARMAALVSSEKCQSCHQDSVQNGTVLHKGSKPVNHDFSNAGPASMQNKLTDADRALIREWAASQSQLAAR